MNKHISEKTSDKKHYMLFETDEEGIRQYKAASEQERIGTSLSKMRVEGKMVPAIKLEVDKAIYDTFKRDQWIEEYRYNQENRCIIGGEDGKSRFCPRRIPNPDYTEGGAAPKTIANDYRKCQYYRSFKSAKARCSSLPSLSSMTRVTKILSSQHHRIRSIRQMSTWNFYMA